MNLALWSIIGIYVGVIDTAYGNRLADYPGKRVNAEGIKYRLMKQKAKLRIFTIYKISLTLNM